LWKAGKQTATTQADRALEHTCAGRVVSALTFIVVVFCLGLWITAFLLIKDQLFVQTFTGNVLTNLTCIVFFWRIGVGGFCGGFGREFPAQGILEAACQKA
jgi:hypothetical protein